MTDEQIAETQLGLKILEELEDLDLNRNIKHRRRFIENEKLRLQRKGARDGDSLALSAREFVWIERFRCSGPRPTSRNSFSTWAFNGFPRRRKAVFKSSATTERILILGFRDEYGF